MNQEFLNSLQGIRNICGFDSPTVKFSSELRHRVEDDSRLEYFEGMITLMECHPIFADISLGSDKLDFRKSLAYEILIRQLGHCRSLIANANILNHIGTAVALRCMIELYAFAIFLVETKFLDDGKFMEKLLYGSIFSSGDWYEYEMVWFEENKEPFPESYKKFLKGILKTPHVSEYLKHAKSKDRGFDYLYATYSRYVHPTFGQPRDQLLEDIGYKKDFMDAIHDRDYYVNAQRNQSPIVSVERHIDAGGLCLEMFWPQLLELDPFFSDAIGVDFFRHLNGTSSKADALEYLKRLRETNEHC